MLTVRLIVALLIARRNIASLVLPLGSPPFELLRLSRSDEFETFNVNTVAAA